LCLVKKIRKSSADQLVRNGGRVDLRASVSIHAERKKDLNPILKGFSGLRVQKRVAFGLGWCVKPRFGVVLVV
jgi:hypothetical protein